MQEMSDRFRISSPVQTALKIFFTIVLTEMLIMTFFNWTKAELWLPSYMIVWIDVIALSLITSAAVYLWVLRPLRAAEKNLKSEKESLKESMENFRAIAENANDAIFIATGEGKHVFVNKRAGEITGFSTEELLKTSVKDLIRPDELAKVTERFRKRLEGEPAPKQYETVFISKDGRSVPVELTASRTIWRGQPASMAIARDITEKKKAEDLLRESEERYRIVAETATDAIITIDEESKMVFTNRAAEKIFGYSEEDLLGQKLTMLMPEHIRDVHINSMKRYISTGEKRVSWNAVEVPGRHKDGRDISLEVAFNEYVKGGRRFFTGIIRDITMRKKLEEQIMQSQKMDAIGQLAGGMAHDFNNILTSIVGYTNILQMKIRDNDPLRSFLEQIISASERATGLTQRLLAFSRKQISNPVPVKLNSIVKHFEKLIRSLIGEDIEFRTELSDKDSVVMADSGQIEQALMNLATNARDAMPDGGVFTIGTGRVTLDREFTDLRGYGEPGEYAMMYISDTGLGMKEDEIERIFEPFYTTKETGKGTGLGLSIVYGMIKQHNGYIDVESKYGKGTTFKIYLPISEVGVEVAYLQEQAPDLKLLRKGTETVLLAEDEPAVRGFMKKILEDFGYKVIDAADGEDAVNEFIKNKDKVQMLVLDVVMPKMNGKEVYEEIIKISPGMKALFVSGYTADILQRKGIYEEKINFISKPVTPNKLLSKVREVLDRR